MKIRHSHLGVYKGLHSAHGPLPARDACQWQARASRSTASTYSISALRQLSKLAYDFASCISWENDSRSSLDSKLDLAPQRDVMKSGLSLFVGHDRSFVHLYGCFSIPPMRLCRYDVPASSPGSRLMQDIHVYRRPPYRRNADSSATNNRRHVVTPGCDYSISKLRWNIPLRHV
jgi:hypothetical protein